MVTVVVFVVAVCHLFFVCVVDCWQVNGHMKWKLRTMKFPRSFWERSRIIPCVQKDLSVQRLTKVVAGQMHCTLSQIQTF